MPRLWRLFDPALRAWRGAKKYWHPDFVPLADCGGGCPPYRLRAGNNKHLGNTLWFLIRSWRPVSGSPGCWWLLSSITSCPGTISVPITSSAFPTRFILGRWCLCTGSTRCWRFLPRCWYWASFCRPSARTQPLPLSSAPCPQQLPVIWACTRRPGLTFVRRWLPTTTARLRH